MGIANELQLIWLKVYLVDAANQEILIQDPTTTGHNHNLSGNKKKVSMRTMLRPLSSQIMRFLPRYCDIPDDAMVVSYEPYRKEIHPHAGDQITFFSENNILEYCPSVEDYLPDEEHPVEFDSEECRGKLFIRRWTSHVNKSDREFRELLLCVNLQQTKDERLLRCIHVRTNIHISVDVDELCFAIPKDSVFTISIPPINIDEIMSTGGSGGDFENFEEFYSSTALGVQSKPSSSSLSGPDAVPSFSTAAASAVAASSNPAFRSATSKKQRKKSRKSNPKIETVGALHIQNPLIHAKER